MKKILKAIRDFFPYALLLYLIFFLLEIFLPGFVSNNFDLNYLLVAVLILGFFSVFAPPIEKEEEPPQKSDRNLIIILSIISFFVLFFRTMDMGASGLVIAIVGSLIVAGMSIILIYLPNDDEEEPVDAIKNKDSTIPPPIQLTQLNIRLGIALLIIMIIIVFFAYKQVNRKTVSTNQKGPTPTTAAISPPAEEEISVPDPDSLEKVSIEILNGSLKIGSASTMAEFLKEKGFKVTKVADADRNDYQNLSIRFRPEEYEVVRYLIEIIQGIYPSIVREPLSTDSAKVIMILGSPVNK